MQVYELQKIQISYSQQLLYTNETVEHLVSKAVHNRWTGLTMWIKLQGKIISGKVQGMT